MTSNVHHSMRSQSLLTSAARGLGAAGGVLWMLEGRPIAGRGRCSELQADCGRDAMARKGGVG